MISINRYIDHTLLKATATVADISRICEEAIQYDFFSVCVNGAMVSLASKELVNTEVLVCSVIGFPLGASSTEAKVFEAVQAINDGAKEIDMVMNLGLFKSKKYHEVARDIKEVKQAIGPHVLKVILETCELNEDEIRRACEICVDANADFVKTSTGFGSAGATEQAVKIMKETVGDSAKVKASGGIRDYETAIRYIDLGVERLGVSSGIAIMEGRKSDSNY